MAQCVKQLSDLCIAAILNDHAGVLQGIEDEKAEAVLKLIAKKQALNASVLKIVDKRKWIKFLDFKTTNLTNEGLCRISGTLLFIFSFFLVKFTL